MAGKGPKSYGGTPVSFFVYGENVDAAWKRAVDAGAKPIQPLDDQFWGDRTGFQDPFGHLWWLAATYQGLDARGAEEGRGGVVLADGVARTLDSRPASSPIPV